MRPPQFVMASSLQVDKLSRDRMHCERIHDEAMQSAKEQHKAELQDTERRHARLEERLGEVQAQLQEAREDTATRVRCALEHRLFDPACSTR